MNLSNQTKKSDGKKRKRNKNKKVYDVRVVEDKTKKGPSILAIFCLVFMTIGIYLFFNGEALYIAINSEEKDFWNVLVTSVKELVYSTGLSFLVFIAVTVANFIKNIAKRKKNK